MQDFYKYAGGYESRATAVANKACFKLVKDKHYVACVQAVITYHANFLNARVPKIEVRNMRLIREQYMQVHIEH